MIMRILPKGNDDGIKIKDQKDQKDAVVRPGVAGCRFQLPSAHQVSPTRFARSFFLRGAKIGAGFELAIQTFGCGVPRAPGARRISMPIRVCLAGSGEREVEINFGLLGLVNE